VPDARTFVVIGASLAGGTAAATLREEGFDGRLVLIGDEPVLPYERPNLSKGYLRGSIPRDQLQLRPAAWWETQEVETRLGVRARSLDPRARTVTLSDGQQIVFDRALVATGVRNRVFDVPGAHLPGIFQLRTVGDADAIHRAAVDARQAVVIGMGFVGAEVAASLRQLGLEVTVVELFETALYRALGIRLGRMLEAIHRDHGVALHFQDSVERFEGSVAVERVITRGGQILDADLVVVGVGTQPNAEVMPGEGIAADGGIRATTSLETPISGVFTAGDVASHQHPVFGEVRVEHFDNGIKMGVHAARGMLGATRDFDDPHWFWSDQWEHQIQMAGVATTGEMVVRGSLASRSFAAFFLDELSVLRACVSIDWKRDCRRALRLIRQQARVDPAALADPDVDLRKIAPA
jgi:3-phenylpropionate/trans-cinnamate dioxygenase ferredoxin reductase subunit